MLLMAGKIRAAVGSVPDTGSVHAAEILAGRLGITVTGDGVAELGRRKLIPVTGCYEKWPVCDGRAIEAFSDAAAAADACRAGYLRTAGESCTYLLIRRSDFGHLTRAGLIEPADWGRSHPYDRRHEFSVPLYRAADLDDLARRDDIDWESVRGARRGQRSPLASLPGKKPERSSAHG
jgi:hypothetical protein